MQGLVDSLNRVGQMVGKRVYDSLGLFAILPCNKLTHASRNILLFLHEGYKQVFIWEFLSIGLGVETILHIVMFYGGMGINCTKPTMVIGENQTIRRDNNA